MRQEGPAFDSAGALLKPRAMLVSACFGKFFVEQLHYNLLTAGF